VHRSTPVAIFARVAVAGGRCAANRRTVWPGQTGMFRPFAPEGRASHLLSGKEPASRAASRAARTVNEKAVSRAQGSQGHLLEADGRRISVRAKSAAVRRQKAAERRERAQTLPEYARTQIERDPAAWFEPYEQARRGGDWKAVEALQDRAHGRPIPAAVSQDFGEIEEGDTVEIRRLLLEAISIEHAATRPPADDPTDEP